MICAFALIIGPFHTALPDRSGHVQYLFHNKVEGNEILTTQKPTERPRYFAGYPQVNFNSDQKMRFYYWTVSRVEITVTTLLIPGQQG